MFIVVLNSFTQRQSEKLTVTEISLYYGDKGGYFNNSVALGQCYGSLICYFDGSDATG